MADNREELYELADEIAQRLGVDPETVMIEPPNRLSLTVQQVRQIMAPVTDDDFTAEELSEAEKEQDSNGPNAEFWSSIANAVLILTIDHNYGFEVSVHRTREQAMDALASWVSESWRRNGPKGDMPDDTDDAIKAYFDFADESWDISEAQLPNKEDAHD